MPSPCIPLLNNVKKDFPKGLKKYLKATGKWERQSTTCTYCLFTPSFLSIAYYDQNNVTTMASCRLQGELIMPQICIITLKRLIKYLHLRWKLENCC